MCFGHVLSTFAHHGRRLSDLVTHPGSGYIVNPARHEPDGFSIGVNSWKGVVKSPQITQHLITFGAVGRCNVTEAQVTKAPTPKWVKTITVKPILGEWERSIAWYGHVSALNEIAMKCYGGVVSFATRHDVAQRTSYAWHCSRPITSFFPATVPAVAAPYVAQPGGGARPQVLKASEEGQCMRVPGLINTHRHSVPVYDARTFFMSGYRGPPFDYRNYTETCPRLTCNIPADALVGVVNTAHFIPNKEQAADGSAPPEQRLMHNVMAVIVFAAVATDLVQ